jgi:hypothetical protein
VAAEAALDEAAYAAAVAALDEAASTAAETRAAAEAADAASAGPANDSNPDYSASTNYTYDVGGPSASPKPNLYAPT